MTNELKKLIGIRRHLNARFLGYKKPIDALIIGLLAKGQVYLVGPPGVGKTDLVVAFAECFGKGWSYTLYQEDTSPDEVLGPYSFQAMRENRLERVSEGRLPSVSIGIADELARGSSVSLNCTLPILSQRQWSQGGKLIDSQLELFVGMSNSLPEGEKLEAFWDRMDLKYDISPIGGKDLLALLQRSSSGESSPPTIQMSAEELEAARASANSIPVPPALISSLHSIVESLNSKGVYVSPRKAVRCLRILKTAAFLDAQPEVCIEHLDILADALWQKRPHRALIEGEVKPLLLERRNRANAIRREVDSTIAQLEAFSGRGKVPSPPQVAQVKAGLDSMLEFCSTLRASKASQRLIAQIRHLEQILEAQATEVKP